MAVALKTALFSTARDVATFCATEANGVTTIVSITYDAASGKFTLFYT